VITDKKAHLALLEDSLVRQEKEFDLWKSIGYPDPMLDLFQKDLDRLKNMIENVKKEIK
jgi:hypothetical protein